MIRAIGPYQLVRKLGRGGMAEVHLATAVGASGFSRAVAIKTLAPELAGDADLERALIHEAVLGGRLHHRNLCAVLGLGVSNGSYYVVLEYLDGGDLARHLDDRVIGDRLALLVVDELSRGLAYLHDARDDRDLPLGIVHRDVGPANVLVSTTGDVKLADFGIAKATALADRTAAGARKGRYSYMAPEQLAGEPVTPAADQVGLGITLYELVTGARPFPGETPWALLDAMRDPTVLASALACLPAELADIAAIVERALAFDARERFSSVRELHAAIVTARRAREPVDAFALGAWVQGRDHFARR